MSSLFNEAARRQGRLEKATRIKSDTGKEPGPYYGKPMPGETQVEAELAANPSPAPRAPSSIGDSPAEKAKYHRSEAEKYAERAKGGTQTIPSVGTPNLNETEKEQLQPDIDMKPR